MGRPISFSVRCDSVPPSTTYRTLTDEEYLRARLARLGGKDAALLELEADEDSATVVARQGIDAKHLPSLARSLLPGDVVIRRTETWHRQAGDRYHGTIHAAIKGTPAVVELTTWIAPTSDGACELGGRGEVTVPVPIVGDRVEKVVAEQVTKLLELEGDFMLRWVDETSS